MRLELIIFVFSIYFPPPSSLSYSPPKRRWRNSPSHPLPTAIYQCPGCHLENYRPHSANLPQHVESKQWCRMQWCQLVTTQEHRIRRLILLVLLLNHVKQGGPTYRTENRRFAKTWVFLSLRETCTIGTTTNTNDTKTIWPPIFCRPFGFVSNSSYPRLHLPK